MHCDGFKHRHSGKRGQSGDFGGQTVLQLSHRISGAYTYEISTPLLRRQSDSHDFMDRTFWPTWIEHIHATYESRARAGVILMFVDFSRHRLPKDEVGGTFFQSISYDWTGDLQGSWGDSSPDDHDGRIPPLGMVLD